MDTVCLSTCILVHEVLAVLRAQQDFRFDLTKGAIVDKEAIIPCQSSFEGNRYG
jgi:hypothetical protein